MLHKLSHKQWTKIAKTISALIVLVLVIIGIAFVIRDFSFEAIREAIRSQGRLGQFVYILFLIFSIIIPPITSLPFWPLALFVYGFWTAVFLTFIGNLTGGMIVYYFARKFGRPFVKKIVGKHRIKEVDGFAQYAGWKAILTLRILSNISFDYVSYAMGLVKFSAVTFFLITAITSFAAAVLTFFILDRAISLGGSLSAVIIISALILSLYGGIRVWRNYKNSKNSTKH